MYFYFNVLGILPQFEVSAFDNLALTHILSSILK